MQSIGINIVLFKLGWLACVISAAQGAPVIGLIAVVAVAAIHLATAREAHLSAKLLGVAAVIGLLWESALAAAGWLDYGANQGAAGLAPYWIVGMWVLFATTLNLSFRWLKERLGLAMVFGAIGGPLAFFGGQKLGAVSFADPIMTPAIIAAGWAILMPLMVYLSRRFDGHAKVQTESATQMQTLSMQLPGEQR